MADDPSELETPSTKVGHIWDRSGVTWCDLKYPLPAGHIGWSSAGDPYRSVTQGGPTVRFIDLITCPTCKAKIPPRSPSRPGEVQTVQPMPDAYRRAQEDVDFNRGRCVRCGVTTHDRGEVATGADGIPAVVCKTCPKGVDFTTDYPAGLEVMVNTGFAAGAVARIESVSDAYPADRPGGQPHYAGRSYVITLPGAGRRTFGESALSPYDDSVGDRYKVNRTPGRASPQETPVTKGSTRVKQAVRHRCENSRNPQAGYHHTTGTGRPKRQKCAGCGGKLLTEHGRWGVFQWNGTGSYPASTANATHLSEQAADEYATSHGDNLVTRWIAEPENPPVQRPSGSGTPPSQQEGAARAQQPPSHPGGALMPVYRVHLNVFDPVAGAGDDDRDVVVEVRAFGPDDALARVGNSYVRVDDHGNTSLSPQARGGTLYRQWTADKVSKTSASYTTEEAAAELAELRAKVDAGPDHGVTRQHAENALYGMSADQLREVAARGDTPTSYLQKTKGDLVSHVVNSSVGEMLDHRVVVGYPEQGKPPGWAADDAQARRDEMIGGLSPAGKPPEKPDAVAVKWVDPQDGRVHIVQPRSESMLLPKQPDAVAVKGVDPETGEPRIGRIVSRSKTYANVIWPDDTRDEVSLDDYSVQWLDREQAKPPADPPEVTARKREVEGRIRDNYRQIADEPGDGVSLGELRAAMPDVSREEFDAAADNVFMHADVHTDPLLPPRLGQARPASDDDDEEEGLKFGGGVVRTIRMDNPRYARTRDENYTMVRNGGGDRVASYVAVLDEDEVNDLAARLGVEPDADVDVTRKRVADKANADAEARSAKVHQNTKDLSLLYEADHDPHPENWQPEVRAEVAAAAARQADNEWEPGRDRAQRWTERLPDGRLRDSGIPAEHAWDDIADRYPDYYKDQYVPAGLERPCSREGCGGTMRPIPGTDHFDADGGASIDTTCDRNCGMQSGASWVWPTGPDSPATDENFFYTEEERREDEEERREDAREANLGKAEEGVLVVRTCTADDGVVVELVDQKSARQRLTDWLVVRDAECGDVTTGTQDEHDRIDVAFKNHVALHNLWHAEKDGKAAGPADDRIANAKDTRGTGSDGGGDQPAGQQPWAHYQGRPAELELKYDDIVRLHREMLAGLTAELEGRDKAHHEIEEAACLAYDMEDDRQRLRDRAEALLGHMNTAKLDVSSLAGVTAAVEAFDDDGKAKLLEAADITQDLVSEGVTKLAAARGSVAQSLHHIHDTYGALAAGVQESGVRGEALQAGAAA